MLNITLDNIIIKNINNILKILKYYLIFFLIIIQFLLLKKVFQTFLYFLKKYI